MARAITRNGGVKMAKHSYLDIGERRGYQWPASALTGQEMAILNDWRERTGVSICELLRQAVKKVDSFVKVIDAGNNINNP